MSMTPRELNLWKESREQGDKSAQLDLFMQYLPWSRSVARDVYRKIRIQQLDWSDYTQNASIGLLEAMKRFEEKRGIDFIAYAKPRVRGSVFNGMRAYLTDGKLNNGNSRLIERSCPADLNKPHESSDVLLDVVSTVTELGIGLLLDSNVMHEQQTSESLVYDAVATIQIARILESFVIQLPKQEHQVIILHYYQYFSFVEIAELMGLTKGRISQIHKSAMMRFRDLLRSANINPLDF